MDLFEMTDHLAITLDDPRHVQTFDDARVRQPGLEAYPNIHEVLVMFEGSRPDDYQESDRVARALVAEAQRGDHQFWCSVLQHAFRPMLYRLRNRIVDRVVESDEIDNIVMLAFWETVLGLPCGPRVDHMCLRIRQGTQRRTFKSIAAEQRVAEDFYLRDHEIIVSLADSYYEPEGEDPLGHRSTCLWPETTPSAFHQPGCAAEQEAQIAFLMEHAGHVLNPDEMEAVVVKLVRGQRLSTHSRFESALEPTSVVQRNYERLRKRHSRGMAKLRKALEPLLQDSETMRRYRRLAENDMCRECRSACCQAPLKAPEAADAYANFSEAGDLSGIA